MKFDGRIMFDVTAYKEDRENLGSDSEIRAARLAIKGSLAPDWKFKTQYDIAENDLSIKDVYLRYDGSRQIDSLTLGDFTSPFSLENLTSGGSSTFMERAALVEVFSTERAIGILADEHGKAWSVNAGLFAGAAGDAPDDEGNVGWGIVARGTPLRIIDSNQLLNLGIAGEYRKPDSSREVRYRTGPESHLTSVNLINTGSIENIKHTRTIGVEVATVKGPLLLQGEYIVASLKRGEGNPGLDFSGWYLYGSWILTGESRPHNGSDGTFDTLIPEGESGAWELGLRLSLIDLDEKDIEGGKSKNITLGVNWYFNPRVRFMINYIQMMSKKEGVSDNSGVLQLRTQFTF